MAERTTPIPDVTPADVVTLRALIELAPAECRYHGARLTRGEVGDGTSWRQHEPCCGTGQVPLYRRRAAEALDRIEAATRG